MTIILCTAVVLVPVALWDFNSMLRKNETSREYQKLDEWADQGTEALENKLDGYFGILESMAVFLEEQELYGKEAEEYLQTVLQKSGVFFDSVSISDEVESTEEIQTHSAGVSQDGYVELKVSLYDVN